MNFFEPNHPPHIPQVTLQELKAWESGQLNLTPDQLIAARYLQNMLANQRDNIIQGEVVACSDVTMPSMPRTLGEQALGLMTV
jgi:hypothetical protein